MKWQTLNNNFIKIVCRSMLQLRNKAYRLTPKNSLNNSSPDNFYPNNSSLSSWKNCFREKLTENSLKTSRKPKIYEIRFHGVRILSITQWFWRYTSLNILFYQLSVTNEWMNWIITIFCWMKKKPFILSNWTEIRARSILKIIWRKEAEKKLTIILM
jgi:hypothetical protein